MINQFIIKSVEKDSKAHQAGIKEGDSLLKINGKPFIDVFDYKLLAADENLILTIAYDGVEKEVEIIKQFGEDIGIEFSSYLMDEAKSCSNKCIFCFIDQLPKNMRNTLYFKDDDSRLSFITGNYVTLTNMSEYEVKRIASLHLSPINISVHTTNPELRKSMLNNKNAPKLLEYMKIFSDANIDMNGQIVLCKGVNDKNELNKTINDLSKFIPRMKSVSVVPVGITKHREGLFALEPFLEQDCKQVIKQVTALQSNFLKKHNTRFVYLADEFYINANVPIPEYKTYEGFPQLENGVGMMSLMLKKFDSYFKNLSGDKIVRTVSVVTAPLAYGHIETLCKRIEKKYVNTKIKIHSIKNNFFGEHITVTGLLTATDIISQLKDTDLGAAIIIPKNALREETFLDDLTVADVQKALSRQVIISDGIDEGFIKAILRVR